MTVSVCCGAKPRSRNDKMFCASCGWACSVETIAQRDHRMRVEGATWAISYIEVSGIRFKSPDGTWSDYVDCDVEPDVAAARIVAEHKEGKR